MEDLEEEEKRSGTSQSNVNSLIQGHHYGKLPGFANISGQLYEIKMAALVFLRAVKTCQNFHLATNMEAAGSFDDVALSHGDKSIFLQLKHRENVTTKIRTSQLIHLGGDFSLLKYCSSYFQMKQQWEQDVDLKFFNCEESMFVVYTNASLVDGVGTEVDKTQLYNVINSGGKCFQFTEDHDKEIFNVFNNLSRYRELLIEATTGEEITNSPELLGAVQKLHNNNAKSIPTKKELNKLLKDLQSLGDLSDFREFLSCLYFCTEQATEKKLDSLIKDELKIVCGTEFVFEKFLAKVQNWWRNSRKFLTEQVHFWQDIVQLLIANLSESTLNQILTLGIQFNSEEIDKIKTVSSSNRVLHIISKFPTLSCRKFQQCLQIRLLIDSSTLLTNLSEVMAVWEFGTRDEVLLVMGGLDSQVIATRLHEVLKKCPSKRLVIVSTENSKVPYQEIDFKTYTDDFSLMQLDVECKEKLLTSQVNFQGYILPLRLLADETALERMLTSDIIKQLLLEDTVSIGEKFSGMEECYIKRKFLRREKVISKVLFDAKVACIAVTGISCNDLKKMFAGTSEEHIIEFDKNNHFESYSDKIYFIIKDSEDFKVLSDRYKDVPVHWFSYCGGNFLWKKSKGDLKLVKNCIDPETDCVEYCGVQEINNIPNKFVMIIAEPGMGKSTELSHVALQVKQDDPTTWVVTVILNDHTDYLRLDKPRALDLLFKAGNFKTSFEKSLFEHQVVTNGNVSIMFDGYDEISPLFSSVVCKILRELSCMNIKSLWLTSRPNMKEELEQTFCTLSFSLKSFTVEEQEEYFLKFWKVQNSSKLKSFITNLLELTAKSLNDKSRNFTGIPLQTKMLAEAFEKDALDCCETGKYELPQKLDILQLYQRFIDRIWDIFYMRYFKVQKVSVEMQEHYQDEKEKFQKNHMICALVSLLTESELKQLSNSDSIIKKFYKFVSKFKKYGERKGIIVHIVNGIAVFVHRTFMEYFVAMWLYNTYKENREFVRNLYLKNNFQVVRHFFDRFLIKKCELHTAVINEDMSLVEILLSKKKVDINETDEGGRTALHYAVVNFISTNDFEKSESLAKQMLMFLLDNSANTSKVDGVLGWQPICLAEETNIWFAVGLILEKGGDNCDLKVIPRYIQNKKKLDAILRTVAQYGFLNLLKFMLEQGMPLTHNFYVYVKGYSEYGVSILHAAAIFGQLNLIDFLLDKGADAYYDFYTPLIYAAKFGHIEVVKRLLEKGVKVKENNLSYYAKTELSLALEERHFDIDSLLIQYGSDVQQVLAFVDCWRNLQIAARLLREGVYLNDKIRETIMKFSLEASVEHGMWRIVLMLIELGANFRETLNSKWSLSRYIRESPVIHTETRTVLMIAASIGDVELFEGLLLLCYNNDYFICYHNGNSILHYAVLSGNIGFVTELLHLGLNPNSVNACGETPVERAAARGKWEMVLLMLNHGRNVFKQYYLLHQTLFTDTVKYLSQPDIKESEIQTRLMVAARIGNCEVLNLLSQHCKDLTFCDGDENSLLHHAVRSCSVESVSYLLEAHLDVNARNKTKETPLLIASSNGNIKLLTLLLDHSADMNACDSFGRTAVHNAAFFGNIDCMVELHKRGVDIDMRNPVLMTPLMISALCDNVDIVRFLLKQSADKRAVNIQGDSALHFAAFSGHSDCINCGIDVNVRNEKMETPLLVAARAGKVDVMKLMLQCNADLMVCDVDGNTVLHNAAMSTVECVAYVLEMGFDINIENNLKATPLLLSAARDKLQIVKYLLEHGADKMSCDKNGNSLLHYAALNKASEVLSYLKHSQDNIEPPV